MIENKSIFDKARSMTQGKIRQIVEGMLPDGQIKGREYVALNPTRNDKNLGSFMINLDTGEWIDFATNDSGGDVISLCAYVKNINKHMAARYLLSAFSSGNINPNYYVKPPKVPKAPKVQNDQALKIWSKSRAAKGTLVETYLCARGYTGLIPDSIRFNQSLYHKDSNMHLPAMVAAVKIWSNDDITAIHRTYLTPCGGKKADVSSNKMMLGVTKGGSVQLANPGKKLILAEGIENALSVSMATNIPIWATLSTSGLVSVIIPSLEVTQEIIIAADNDEAGLKAANQLANRLLKQGYKVKIAKPSGRGEDFNDVLLGGEYVSR